MNESVNSKKVKIGVFGGARGSVMVHQLLNHPDAELVAVCDKYEPLLENCQRAAQEARATRAARNSTNEAGRIGERPYARGRSYKADRYET